MRGPVIGLLKRGVRRAALSLPAAQARDLLLGIASTRSAAERYELLGSLLRTLAAEDLRELCVSLARGTPFMDDLLSVLIERGFSPRREVTLDLVRASLRKQDSADAFRTWEALRHVARGHQATLDHVIHAYASMVQVLEGTLGASLEGKRVLEYGPGHTLLGGLLTILWGAERYDGVDPFPIAQLDPELFASLRRRLADPGLLTACSGSAAAAEQQALLARFDSTLTLSDTGATWDTERMQLHQQDAASLSFSDSSVDLVFSTSVLEHVQDLNAVANECVRVLRPGGIALHQVDFRDHRDFARPWDFLERSTAEWDAKLAETPFDFTNRVRVSGLLEAFASDELELIHRDDYERATLPPGKSATFAAEFQGMSQADQETLGCLVAYRKRGPR